VAGVLLERGSIANDVESKSTNKSSLPRNWRSMQTNGGDRLRRALTLWPKKAQQKRARADRYCKAPGEIGIQNDRSDTQHSGSALGDSCLWERAPPGPLAMRGERKSSYAIQSAIQSFIFPGFVFTLALFPCCRRLRCDNGGEPMCPDNTALFNPGGGEDIGLPSGFQARSHERPNFPTGIAFLSHGNGRGLMSTCWSPGTDCRAGATTIGVAGGEFAAKIRSPRHPRLQPDGTPAQCSASPRGRCGLQPEGPAIDIAFEDCAEGGDEDEGGAAGAAVRKRLEPGDARPLTGKTTAHAS